MQAAKKWGTDMTIIVTNEMKNEATSMQKDGYRLGRYKKLYWDPCTARNDSHLSNASIYIYIDLRFLDRYCVIYQQPISREQPVSGSTKKASHSTHFHAEEWCGHSVHSGTFPGARQPSVVIIRGQVPVQWGPHLGQLLLHTLGSCFYMDITLT